MQTIHAIGGNRQILDVLGVAVEFVTTPAEAANLYCVIKGTIPAGMAVPLHSHPDPESFYVVSGSEQILAPIRDRLEWLDVRAGDFVHIPAGAKHAHRNTSSQPVVELVVMSATLGRFFEEAGRPMEDEVIGSTPSPADVERLQRVAAKYGHWLGTPAENAAVGITI
ncbi:MAG TPA: cupin domain-containing protein [Vicinamibacterales bacterium]|jgi:quercetin dioxygenase-like cupin family protein